MRLILLNIRVQNILLFILLSEFFHCHISHLILVYLCIMEILIVIGHRILVALLNLCLVLSFLCIMYVVFVIETLVMIAT